MSVGLLLMRRGLATIDVPVSGLRIVHSQLDMTEWNVNRRGPLPKLVDTVGEVVSVLGSRVVDDSGMQSPDRHLSRDGRFMVLSIAVWCTSRGCLLIEISAWSPREAVTRSQDLGQLARKDQNSHSSNAKGERYPRAKAGRAWGRAALWLSPHLQDNVFLPEAKQENLACLLRLDRNRRCRTRQSRRGPLCRGAVDGRHERLGLTDLLNMPGQLELLAMGAFVHACPEAMEAVLSRRSVLP